MSHNILVLGSNGKTGKRVAARLQHFQLPARLGSRKGKPSFDWDKPEHWPEVLRGIESVYLTFQPDLAVPQALEKIKLFTALAKANEVQKIVLLSGRGEQEAEVCEQVIMQSGLNWAVLRASWFMQNFSESFLLDAVLNNEVILPPIKSLEPFVDADDIADVAVAALTSGAHNGQIYELTGPELLSFESATASIAKALNRKITYTEISMEAYAEALRSFGLPDYRIALMTYLFTEVLDGRNESLSKDIEKILSRKPASFDTYIDKTIKNGSWNRS